jgi:predicted aldo/keto reductase-like oxidoreductase
LNTLIEKRQLPSLGLNISLLGFGTMRLPLHPGSKKNVDQPLAEAMFDKAITAGVNYFDTAFPYHTGTSEILTGRFLGKYPRESFFLATKLPLWTLKSQSEAEIIFRQQHKKCRVEYFDFYLLHGLNQTLWNRAEHLKIYDWLCEKKAQGLARRIGFSFHDSPFLFKTILDSQVWDFAQIQLNYVDWEIGKADLLYALLEEKKIPAIVMEPVRGGQLATLAGDAGNRLKILQNAEGGGSQASWAIRYAASLSGVMTVLSGMSRMEHVEDNIRTMQKFCPVTDAEKNVLKEVAALYLSQGDIPCTGCGYCATECSQEVDIPGVFSIYNRREERGFTHWYSTLAEDTRAQRCIACRACIERCPQHIDIPARLRQVAKYASEL